jgi:hypothetical protein
MVNRSHTSLDECERYCGGTLETVDPQDFDLTQECYLRLMLDGKHPIRCTKCEYVTWVRVQSWKEVRDTEYPHLLSTVFRCDQVLSDV